MKRTKKLEIVEDLRTRLARSPALYLADFTGIAVKPMTELRRRLRAAGVDFVVVKNTLAQRALAEAEVAGLDGRLEGPTGVVLAGADPVAAAKILAEFQREHESLRVKVGLVEGRTVGPAEVQRLATLPPREQLLAQLAGTLQAPLAGLAGVWSAFLYQVVGALEALKAQRAGG